MAIKKKAQKKPVARKRAAAEKSPKRSEQAPASKDATVTVHIMGKAHEVPAEATIMGAIEHAGYQIKRGAGCREGFCGACATVFRLPGDYRIYTGLACTTLVQDEMYLTQLPSHPAHKTKYDLEKLEPSVATIQALYPETFRCVACNTCTKSCPQDLEVMDYIQAAKQGNIERLMDLSFDCLHCGLCAIRCPAEIVQMNVGQLGRRLHGRYVNPRSKHLDKRLREVEKGKYDKEYRSMMKMAREKLSDLYYARDLES